MVEYFKRFDFSSNRLRRGDAFDACTDCNAVGTSVSGGFGLDFFCAFDGEFFQSGLRFFVRETRGIRGKKTKKLSKTGAQTSLLALQSFLLF